MLFPRDPLEPSQCRAIWVTCQNREILRYTASTRVTLLSDMTATAGGQEGSLQRNVQPNGHLALRWLKLSFRLCTTW